MEKLAVLPRSAWFQRLVSYCSITLSMSVYGLYILRRYAFIYFEQKLLQIINVGAVGGKKKYTSKQGFKNHIHFLQENEEKNPEFHSFRATIIETDSVHLLGRAI